MSRVSDWLLDTNHPLRLAFVALLLGSVSAYGASHIRNSDSIISILGWFFAAAGAIGFLAFLVIAICERAARNSE